MYTRDLSHTAIARRASADSTLQSTSSDGSLSAITIPIVFGTIGAVFALIDIIIGFLKYRRTASRNIPRDPEAQLGRMQDWEGFIPPLSHHCKGLLIGFITEIRPDTVLQASASTQRPSAQADTMLAMLKRSFPGKEHRVPNFSRFSCILVSLEGGSQPCNDCEDRKRLM